MNAIDVRTIRILSSTLTVNSLDHESLLVDGHAVNLTGGCVCCETYEHPAAISRSSESELCIREMDQRRWSRHLTTASRPKWMGPPEFVTDLVRDHHREKQCGIKALRRVDCGQVDLNECAIVNERADPSKDGVYALFRNSRIDDNHRTRFVRPGVSWN